MMLISHFSVIFLANSFGPARYKNHNLMLKAGEQRNRSLQVFQLFLFPLLERQRLVQKKNHFPFDFSRGKTSWTETNSFDNCVNLLRNWIGLLNVDEREFPQLFTHRKENWNLWQTFVKAKRFKMKINRDNVLFCVMLSSATGFAKAKRRRSES